MTVTSSVMVEVKTSCKIILVLSILLDSIITEALRIVYCNGRELRTDIDTSSILCDSGSEVAVLNTTCQLYCPETYDPEVQFFKCHLFGWFPTTAPKCSQNSSVTLIIVPAMLGSIAFLFVLSFSVAMYKRRRRRQQQHGDQPGHDTEANWKVKRRLHYLKTNPALAKDLSEVREKINKEENNQPDPVPHTDENSEKTPRKKGGDESANDKKVKTMSRRKKFTNMFPKRRKVSVWSSLKKSTLSKGKKLSDFRQRSVERCKQKLRFDRPSKAVETSDSYTDCTSSDDSSTSGSDASDTDISAKEKLAGKEVEVQIEAQKEDEKPANDEIVVELGPGGEIISMTPTPSKTHEKAIIDKILIESVISKEMNEEMASYPHDIKHYKAKSNHKRKKKEGPIKQGYDNYNTSAYNRQYHDFGNDYRRTEHYFDGNSYQPSHMNTVQYYPIHSTTAARAEEEAEKRKKAKKERKKKAEKSASNSTTRSGVKYFSIKPSKTNIKLEKYKGPSRYAPRVLGEEKKHKEARERASKVRRVTRDKKKVRDDDESRRRRTDSKKRNDRDRSKSRKRRRRKRDDNSDWSDCSSSERDDRRKRKEKDDKRRHREVSPPKHRTYRNKNYEDSPPSHRRTRRDRHEDEAERRKKSYKRNARR